jgi:2-keto-3-deoxy-L-rhamnonate aldolase RhmA
MPPWVSAVWHLTRLTRTTVAQARRWLELGFNVISFGADVAIYIDALADGVARVRELVEQRD